MDQNTSHNSATPVGTREQHGFPAATITAGLIAVIKVRILNRMSVRALASRLGMSEDDLHKILFGIEPLYVHDIAGLADVLGMSVVDLAALADQVRKVMNTAAVDYLKDQAPTTRVDRLTLVSEDPTSGVNVYRLSVDYGTAVVGFLRDTYGQELENVARGYHFDGKHHYFECGGGYDVVDQDLLGGTGSGQRAIALDQFLRGDSK